jgi:hypothetical protein
MATIYKKSLGRGLSGLIEDIIISEHKAENLQYYYILKEKEKEYIRLTGKCYNRFLSRKLSSLKEYSKEYYDYFINEIEQVIIKETEKISQIQKQNLLIKKLQQERELKAERERKQAELKADALAKQVKIINAKKQVKPKKTYLIKNLKNGFYKIGYSNNPTRREKTLQSEEPTIKMVKVWDKFIEKELHHKYKEQRIRGEWFRLTPIQVKYICTHY